MSRVLNRPMFRLGGSTSGITAGLDKPKRGRVDEPGSYQGIDYEKAYETEQRITDKYYPKKGADINRFLIDWGLNMVGNPPSGNVLQTAAKQAQKPTAELFESMDRSKAMRGATGADIFGKMIEAEGEMMGGEGGAKWRDQWALGKVKKAYKDIYLMKDELKTLDPKVDTKRIKEIQYEIGQSELDISQLQKDNPLLKTFAGQKEIVKDLYDAVTKKYEEMKEEIIVTQDNIEELPDGSVIGQTITREKFVKDSPELVAAVIQEIQNMFGGTSLDVSILLDTDAKATGGRVGYQGGELVEDESMVEATPAGMMEENVEEVTGEPTREQMEALAMEIFQLRLEELDEEQLMVVYQAAMEQQPKEEMMQEEDVQFAPQTAPAMAAEGGIMDLGGVEKDYRQEGGFVPLGKKEKADDVPARLSKNEFVFTADAVRNAGGGNINKGAEVMQNMMENLESGGQISEDSQGAQGMYNNMKQLETRIA